MLKRNLTALALIAIVLFFVLYLRTVIVELSDILFFAFIAVGAFEMYAIGKRVGLSPMILPLILCLVVLYPLYFFFDGTGILFAGLIGVLCVLSVFLLKREKYTLNDAEYSAFILFYPILLGASFFLLNRSAGNLLGIFLVLFVTLLTDAFALFFGMLFGKRKLIPDVSPKKTIAGAVGGYVGGVLGATVVFLLFDVFHVFDKWKNVGLTAISDKLYISIPLYLAIALIGSTLAIIGDLTASWIKRKMAVKDFGKIFPGHGGVMDRLDSLLFVAPFVTLFFIIYNGVICL